MQNKNHQSFFTVQEDPAKYREFIYAAAEELNIEIKGYTQIGSQIKFYVDGGDNLLEFKKVFERGVK